MQNTALIRTTDNEPQGICQHRVTEVGSQASRMMSSRASMAESSVQGKKRMPRWYKEGRKRCLWWEHGQPGRLNSTSPSGRTSRKIKVSPSHSSVVLPSSPGHPASSLEVSLTGKQAHLWNGKEFINGGWCTAVYSTYIICTWPASTVD